jgi:FKBP-type peptidyl-prolyl cis-trans isomerase
MKMLLVSVGTVMVMVMQVGASAATPPAAAAAPATSAPATAGTAGKPAAGKSAGPLTEEQKTLYALGLLISRNLESFALSPAEFSTVKSGLTDGFTHHASQVDLSVYGPKVQQLQHERVALLTKKQMEEGQAYLVKVAALPGAHKTSSGLVIVPIRAGTGASPGREDRVKVNYEGKLIDGTVFDSSIKRGEPMTFTLTGVIPCWTEALQLMKVGEKSRVICPANLAYGERGAPPQIRPGSTLDFEVELLEVAPPVAPPAATAPPAPGAAPAASPTAQPGTRGAPAPSTPQ